jgi:hypothetical protein
MPPRELDQLLRRSASADAAGAGSLPRGFATALRQRLGRRESWRNVCLLLGAASALAFLVSLALASRTAPPSLPELRLFHPQPGSRPFSLP